jgi:hypothetical protein
MQVVWLEELTWLTMCRGEADQCATLLGAKAILLQQL